MQVLALWHGPVKCEAISMGLPRKAEFLTLRTLRLELALLNRPTVYGKPYLTGQVREQPALHLSWFEIMKKWQI